MKKASEKTEAFFMVGVAGLEPATSRSQSARASQLRHTPIGSNRGDYILFSLNVLATG